MRWAWQDGCLKLPDGSFLQCGEEVPEGALPPERVAQFVAKGWIDLEEPKAEEVQPELLPHVCVSGAKAEPKKEPPKKRKRRRKKKKDE